MDAYPSGIDDILFGFDDRMKFSFKATKALQWLADIA